MSAMQIAEQCEISKGLLFHYFEDKNGFYVEVLRRASEELIDLTKRSDHLRGKDRLVAVIGDYLGWIEEHPRVYQMLLNSDLGTHPKVRKIHERKRAHYQAVILDALFPGESANLERAYNFIGASSYVEGMVLHWLCDRSMPRDSFQKILLEGIARIILPR